MAREVAPEGRAPVARLADEARETGGVTSALLFSYLDRLGGGSLVDDVLDRCGLSGSGRELRDENCWFSWQTKIRLFEATVEATKNPGFLDEMAALALELNVAPGLKVALRTLGSPALVYRSVIRANGRFNSSHVMELVSLRRNVARISFADGTGAERFHPLDCAYSAAMLRIVPQLFGLPRAELRHLACVGAGDPECVYELRWREHVTAARRSLATTVVAGGALLGSLTIAPSLLPEAIGLAMAGAGALSLGELRRLRKAWQGLQREADDHAEVARRLISSLQDLASDLRLDEVLAKVTRNAQAALGGREFALLVREEDSYVTQGCSERLPDTGRQTLESWCNADTRVARDTVVIDSIGAVPGLTPLTTGDPPLQSLASAPLISFGESLGVLIALGAPSHAFLPRELEVLESFASQVAIALHNARRYHLTKTQADRDALTGLLNHRSFHDAVERTLGTAGVPRASLVLIDLDNFKQVNDEDGHGAGDEILRATARVLAAACRNGDFAFRVGGDEFALLIDGADEPAAATIAEQACAGIAELDGRLGASAGVAELASGLDKDDVIRRADRQLYRAKDENRGRRRVAVSAGGVARVTVDVLLSAIELHHPATAEHCRRTAELAEQVATKLGADSGELALTRQIALLHDVGKLSLPVALLDREEPLDAGAWMLVRRHPLIGAELIGRVPGLEALAEGVLRSQERLDGSGYPAGLTAVELPRPVRIVSACDAFVAMSAERPYRRAMTEPDALAELSLSAGTCYDRHVVSALVEVVHGGALRAA